MTKYYKVLEEGFKTYNHFQWKINGEWNEEKDCDENTGDACGKGLHVWKDYPRFHISRYIEDHVFEVECEGLLDQDDNKARFRKVKLVRLVKKEEIFKNGANLSGADLNGADLSGAHNCKNNEFLSRLQRYSAHC